MADEELILDLNPESHQTIPDLGSVLKLDAKNPSAVFFLQAATLRQGKCLTVGVPGFRIVTEQPKIASCPFVLRLKGAEDFVCLCFKGNGANLYCYGLSVEDLLKWKKLEKGDDSEESGFPPFARWRPCIEPPHAPWRPERARHTRAIHRV